MRVSDLDLALVESRGNVVTQVDPFLPGEFYGQLWVNKLSSCVWWWNRETWTPCATE